MTTIRKHDTILISSCLLGEQVRYDGKANLITHPILTQWLKEERVVSFCPEVAGGLGTPRPPVEIKGGSGEDVLTGGADVVTADGYFVTEQFVQGAHLASDLARINTVRVAILKERSPSCGSSLIYDGTFSRNTQNGQGVTTALLRWQGVHVFNEFQLEEADAFLKAIESSGDPP